MLGQRFATTHKEENMKEKSNNKIIDMLERNFAAAGLAEGDPDIARKHLENEPASPLWAKMKEVYAKGQHHFVAAALAEESHVTARRYMEENLDYSKESFTAKALAKAKQWLQSLQHTYTAAGLAEGDPDLALAYMKVQPSEASKATKASQATQPSRPKQSLRQFLATTGLKDVRFQYGIATV